MNQSAISATITGFPRALAYTLVFNTIVALLLTVVGFGGTLGANLIYSQCIGLSMLLIVNGGWQLLWRGQRPPAVGMITLIACAIPAAWLLGTALAAALLGDPWLDAAEKGGLAVLTITAAAGIVGTAFFWTRARLAYVEAEAADAKLRLLQAQIEPHFLFNTLANLHSLIGSDPSRAQKMLEHLNDYLRATLSVARADTSTLAEEFALLRGYLEVLAMRMGERLRYNLSLPQELEREPVPPMLLQPLVENAIKHGLEPKVDGGRIAIAARAESGTLVLTVADTGLGLGASNIPGTGLGVAHVRRRLAARYGARAAFDIAQDPAGGTVATLRLPLGK